MITLAFWTGFAAGAVMTLVVIEALVRSPAPWRDLDARIAALSRN